MEDRQLVDYVPVTKELNPKTSSGTSMFYVDPLFKWRYFLSQQYRLLTLMVHSAMATFSVAMSQQ
jgi:hypothetical protein